VRDQAIGGAQIDTHSNLAFGIYLGRGTGFRDL
jgi:hypothetical protein